MKTFNRFILAFCILVVSCLLPAAVPADTTYDRLVVFGDSLSDPGNAYVLTGMSLVPPYTDLIPEHPYARGGQHLSNGSTWIEQLASQMKLVESVGSGPACAGGVLQLCRRPHTCLPAKSVTLVY